MSERSKDVAALRFDSPNRKSGPKKGTEQPLSVPDVLFFGVEESVRIALAAALLGGACVLALAEGVFGIQRSREGGSQC